ncbi:hypothetical protein SAMN04487936_11274 [Halobacillus dabanensis]|uniref:Uncharacterized protein n=1 Tax=Halobacillus dabanensis TaxID=240302 RepID=A0A1I3YZF1_HALDA|nr:hypothetical protein [Halobacillus dabanensis]SFK37237.1 hypothetical protein SAMN04487936_11274 [Halobacillus dabanensis]
MRKIVYSLLFLLTLLFGYRGDAGVIEAYDPGDLGIGSVKPGSFQDPGDLGIG